MQWLQYRILHRLLPVGYYLKKINLKNTDSCNFCNSMVETILHIFLQCDKVTPLWHELSLHIYRATTSRVGFNASNIIFGELPLNRENRILNFIILYVKQYIFSCIYRSNIPTLNGLLCHLKTKFYVERYIAIQNSTLPDFENRWTKWRNIFEPELS